MIATRCKQCGHLDSEKGAQGVLICAQCGRVWPK